MSVVVDDGSHRSEHVLATFAHVFPRLPAGAVYAIEDTETSYWSDYGGSTAADAPTTMNRVKHLVDSLNDEEFTTRDHVPTPVELGVTAVHADHDLVFVEKGHNVERGGRRHAGAERAAREGGTGREG